MNRRDVLRRVAGATAVGTTALIGGLLDPRPREETEVDHGEGGVDEAEAAGSVGDDDGATDASTGEQATVSPDENPDADGSRANPAVAEQLYAAHSDRCMCPACSGSPPGNP